MKILNERWKSLSNRKGSMRTFTDHNDVTKQRNLIVAIKIFLIDIKKKKNENTTRTYYVKGDKNTILMNTFVKMES